MKGQRFYNKAILIWLLFPLGIFAQQVPPAATELAGLWKGSLYNDSTKETLPYELAISEEDGKLTGYSYTQFDIDGKKEIGVKKIKIARTGNQLTIEDVTLVTNTYAAPPPRKVRQQSIVELTVQDTLLQLTGRWSTNRTREYLPLTGNIQVEKKSDYRPQVLFKILATLKLDGGLSFIKAERKAAEIALNRPASLDKKAADSTPPLSSDPDKPREIIAFAPEKINEPVTKNQPGIQLSSEAVAKHGISRKDTMVAIPPDKTDIYQVLSNLTLLKTRPASGLFLTPAGKRKIAILPITPKGKELYVAARDKRKEAYLAAYNKSLTVIAPPVQKQPAPVASVPKPVTEKPVATPRQETTAKAVAPAVKEAVKPPATAIVVSTTPPEQKAQGTAKPVATPANVAANIAERVVKNEQSFYFESDSLVLTLYDNGDVDGDTVSVLMNGQVIFARQGLSTKANSKTVYVEKGGVDSLSMIMYAENLGAIPPNTGLLIIMDGQKRYEVRFSADLKTNAAILLRRRIKPN